MKRAAAVVLTVFGLGGFNLCRGADVSVGVDVASAYVFRGITLNDSLVVQPSLTITPESALTQLGGEDVTILGGVWGNFDVDDYEGALEKGEFSELDLFLSAAVPLSRYVVAETTYTEFVYPGGAHSDRELLVACTGRTFLSPKLTVAYGVDGAIEDDLYYELGIGHVIEFPNSLAVVTLGADVGYMDLEGGGAAFSHYDLKTAILYGPLSVGVTYIGQIDEDVLPDGAFGYDSKWVGSVSLAHQF